VIITIGPWYNQFLDLEGKNESKTVVTITKRFNLFWKSKYDALKLAKVTFNTMRYNCRLIRAGSTHQRSWLKQLSLNL